jgi:hypothetical protein
MHNQFLEAWQKKVSTSLNVCMPGIIESYDFKTQKANIKIDSKRIEDNDQLTEYPVISGVPIIMPSSGGAYISMPVEVGDSCLVLFTDKDISNWLNGLSNQKPETKRIHSLSDGVAIMGLKPFTKSNNIENNNDLCIHYKNTTIKIKDNSDVEIISQNHIKVESKTAEINLSHDASIKCRDVNLLSSGSVNVETPNFNIKGDLHLEGKASGKNNQPFKINSNVEVTGKIDATQDIKSDADVKAGSISLKNHTHLYSKPVVGSSPTAAIPAQTGGAT